MLCSSGPITIHQRCQFAQDMAGGCAWGCHSASWLTQCEETYSALTLGHIWGLTRLPVRRTRSYQLKLQGLYLLQYPWWIHPCSKVWVTVWSGSFQPSRSISSSPSMQEYLRCMHSVLRGTSISCRSRPTSHTSQWCLQMLSGHDVAGFKSKV